MCQEPVCKSENEYDKACPRDLLISSPSHFQNLPESEFEVEILKNTDDYVYS